MQRCCIAYKTLILPHSADKLQLSKGIKIMKLHNRVNGEELRQRMLASDEPRTTLSFYKYYQLGNPQVFRDHIYLQWAELEVFGRIYVANEGINGQLSVPTKNFEAFKDVLNDITFMQDMRLNIAIEDDGKSFFKLKILVREKILADGLNDDTFDVTNKGVHLDAARFNDITADPNTILVDMRNHYESEVGHFKGAITPDVETFRSSLPEIEDMLKGNEEKNIVMYCTGGIRCEKASAYYKHRGFKNVYQLDGGIIEYARQANEQNLENKFIGKNFVFDERLGEKISDDVISQCHQCGAPCDDHTNCANDACHILFIQCPSCAKKYAENCSQKCKDFSELPEEKRQPLKGKMEFNGTKFGKGRYKAYHKEKGLNMT